MLLGLCRLVAHCARPRVAVPAPSVAPGAIYSIFKFAITLPVGLSRGGAVNYSKWVVLLAKMRYYWVYDVVMSRPAAERKTRHGKEPAAAVRARQGITHAFLCLAQPALAGRANLTDGYGFWEG